MRKTKIICTVGPSCMSEDVLEQMCLSGMNVARMNFSHGDHDEQLRKITAVKNVRKKLNLPIAIMLDTKGPEYRIGIFKDGKITLKQDDPFTFTTDDIVGDQTKVSVSYKNMHQELNVGDTILLVNGLLSFVVEKVEGHNIHCRTVVGGELGDRKSMSFPGKVLKQIYLSEQDKNDLLFGIEHDVDLIACSFVSTKQDLLDVKKFLKENGDPNISLIAKIENQTGVDNIEDICTECDGIMIGRGDMGVEIPFEELPAIQKKLITKCRLMGKQVITATEMLESMIYNARPTRAETSDVANAVYDGTSAIMLSGETAMGKYPVLAVRTMARIAEHTEQNIHYKKRFYNYDFKIHNTVDALSHATCGMAIDVDAKAIVACSLSGSTARMVCRFRPPMDILGLTADKKTWRQLALSWGVIPQMIDLLPSSDVMFYTAAKVAKQTLNLQPGDNIVITGGNANISGNTNMLKIVTL